MRIPLISFFTGGGFLDIGFHQAGFDIFWTNESNPLFIEMYEHGIESYNKRLKNKMTSVKISDTRSIDIITPTKIIKSAFLDRIPRLFGIIGGPPCPDFAAGGKHRGHEGDHGRLSQTYADRICTIRPSFFVFENVTGLVEKNKHKIFLKLLEKQFEDSGYCLDRRILNSLNYGLAQDRERVFLIGIKRSLIKRRLGKNIKTSDRNWFPWPKSHKYHNSKTKFKWPDVVLNGKKPRKPYKIPEELTVNYLISDIENIPNADEGFIPYSKKFKTVKEGDTSGKSFKRLHRYRYSPTACYGNNEVHLHPWERRRLTVREAMRIQGIPDSYVLPTEMQLTAKFKMIANGVPVPLAKEVAKKLYKFLNTRK